MDNNISILRFAAILLFLASIPLHSFGQFFVEAPDFFPKSRSTDLSTNVAIADIDKDNDNDLILLMESGTNILLINNGQSQYVESDVSGSVANSIDIATADFDGDNDLDLLFVSEISSYHNYFSNNGQGKFSKSSLQVSLNGSSVVKAFDINDDEMPDLLIGRNGQNLILINKGDGTFRDETNYRLPKVDDITNDLSLFDFDLDGDLDIFVSNEARNLLLINNGVGAFTDETFQRLPAIPYLNTQNAAIGDVDQDGFLDIYLSNADRTGTENPQNRLFKNIGGEYFFDVTQKQLPIEALQSIDANLIDLDNDGDLDIATANNGHQPISLYVNDGTGKYTNKTTSYLGEQSFNEVHRILSEDFNNDGYQDLYVCLKGQRDMLLLRDPDGTEATTTSTNEAIAYANSISLYPNPVTSYFNLSFPEKIDEELQFELYTLSGQLVRSLQANFKSDTEYQFNLNEPNENLIEGLYLLRIYSANATYTKKIQIKSRY